MTQSEKSPVNWTPDPRSKESLKNVHPDLVDVVLLANVKFFARHGVYFTAIEGVRSQERQYTLFGQGRTKAECVAAGINAKYAKPGDKVTWTLISNHFAHKDGKGRAVDLCNIQKGVARWNDAALIAECMFEAAKELGVPIRWGKDWNRNGKPGEKGENDGPHFELWGDRYG